MRPQQLSFLISCFALNAKIESGLGSIKAELVSLYCRRRPFHALQVSITLLFAGKKKEKDS